jgi:hypothetical protein
MGGKGLISKIYNKPLCKNDKALSEGAIRGGYSFSFFITSRAIANSNKKVGN